MKALPKKIKFEEESIKRLDVFLAEILETSRSQAQKVIIDNDVSINDKKANKGGLMLKPNDLIKIEKKVVEKPTPKAVAEKKEKEKIPKINVVALNKDYIVIEKPNGLLTHSTDKNEANSIATIFSKKYPELKKVGDDPKRPGIVHRLDKEASGLLVIARTQKMFDHLKAQFKDRTVQKEYAVLVHGKVYKDSDQINFNLERARSGERMSALPSTVRGEINTTGKNALTEFWVEQRFINFTLLKVKIHTGRMHQIRVHFLAYDNPLVGDPLYFQKKHKDKWDKICGRMFLHCTRLGFTDLTGEYKEFTSELPKKLADFLLLLK